MSEEEQQMHILKNIEQLQQVEKELYKELQSASAAGASATGPSTSASGPSTSGPGVAGASAGPSAASETGPGVAGSLPTQNITAIINKINQISQVRMSLYKSLNDSYKSLQTTVNTKRSELVELLTVVSVVEEELNNAKTQLNQLYEIKNNKMRMVEINTYYGKKYKAQASVMKLFILVGTILLILLLLWKKSLLPTALTNVLIGIVIAVGGFFIIRRILDIYWRDNMNFDSYSWFYNPHISVPTVYDYNKQQLHGLISNMRGGLPTFNGIDCIGNACCTAGMNYDTKTRTCIKSIAPETFVSGQLTKHVFNNKVGNQKGGDSFGDSNPNYPSPYGDNESIKFASY
jgi:hypothetical protein